MLNHFIDHALPMLGAAVLPAYRYLGETQHETLEYYNLARTRTRTATFVLNLFATLVSYIILTKGVDREELFERYDVKLWSFDDNLVLFAVATAPSVALLAILYGTYRCMEAVRSALSL